MERVRRCTSAAERLAQVGILEIGVLAHQGDLDGDLRVPHPLDVFTPGCHAGFFIAVAQLFEYEIGDVLGLEKEMNLVHVLNIMA